MPREIITISAGQCGNQQSANFWERLCLEHGISPDGTVDPDTECYDRKDVFFYQSDEGRYIPRSVMLDLESKVIQRVVGSEYGALYNPENLFFPESGGTGAGNNWAAGYTQGDRHVDLVLEMLDRECENSDSLEAFMLFHSLAGGTGSGFGSLIMERVRDHFPKKILQTVSVLPSSGESGSEVVVQPYNSVLTLQRLVQSADSVLLVDNKALKRIKAHTLAGTRRTLTADIDVQETNVFVSQALLAATAPIRFPGYVYNNWASILTEMIPVPDFHFLVPTYSPFVAPDAESSLRFVRKTSVNELLHRLVQAKHSMLAVTPSALQASRFVAVLRVVRGDPDVADFRKQIYGMQERDSFQFAKAFAHSSQVVVAKQSPHAGVKTRLSGVGLWNNTVVGDSLNHVLREFQSMYQKGAFMSSYKQFPMFENGLDEFRDAQEQVQTVVDTYASL